MGHRIGALGLIKQGTSNVLIKKGWLKQRVGTTLGYCKNFKDERCVCSVREHFDHRQAVKAISDKCQGEEEEIHL